MAKPKNLLKVGLHAAVLLGIGVAGVKTINGDEFRKALTEFDWVYAPFVALLGILSMVIKSWRFGTLLKQAVEVDRWTAMKAYIAGQSATLLPGGVAARAGMLAQIGVPVEKSTPAIALSSLTDQIGFLLCGITAALWFESARKPVLILLAVLGAVSVFLGIQAVRVWLGRLVEKILGRFNLVDKWRGFLEGMKESLTPKILVVGVLNTFVAFAVLILALYLCMRGVGHELSPIFLLLAFALPTMFGRISAIPGGVGLTEAGMVGVLDRASGVTLDQAAAAVLVFRLGTVLVSALAGGILYLFAWRGTTGETNAEGETVAA